MTSLACSEIMLSHAIENCPLYYLPSRSNYIKKYLGFTKKNGILAYGIFSENLTEKLAKSMTISFHHLWYTLIKNDSQ